MKFCTFVADDAARVGVVEGDVVFRVDAVATMQELIGGWPANRAAIEGSRGARHVLTDLTLLPPIPRPGKVLCSGVNYHGHFAENPNAKMPAEPFFFAKLSTSIVGHGAAIEHPERTEQLDYEVEFAVVIGRRLHRAAEAEVMPAIFGYTLLNDVSARDVQFRESQITLGKNFDGFAPVGPWIVTADEIPDPSNVRLRAILNGRTMQDGSTSDWIFPLTRLLGFLSHTMALEPGDIVTTGTPAGVGLFQRPPVFMRAGDVIAIEADGIGRLQNRITSVGENA